MAKKTKKEVITTVEETKVTEVSENSESKTTEKTVAEMTNKEILDSVDAGDYDDDDDEDDSADVRYNSDDDDDDDDELVDEPVEVAKENVTSSAKTTKIVTKAQKIAEQKAHWLENAKITEDGKYQIIYMTGGSIKAAPQFFIVKNDFKTPRIGLSLVYDLIGDDKAIEISLEQVKLDKKASKKTKATKAAA